MLGRAVRHNRCCVLISWLTFVTLGGSQATVFHLLSDPHLHLLGSCINSFSVNCAGSFRGSPRSLRLEEIGSGLSCKFQFVLVQLHFTSSFSSQLLALLTYGDFRPNAQYKSNAFYRFLYKLPQLCKV